MIKCPYCGSDKVKEKELAEKEAKYTCEECNTTFCINMSKE